MRQRGVLPLLAFFGNPLQARADAPFPCDTLAHAEQALPRIGYRFAPDERGSTSGALSHAGLSVRAAFDGQDHPDPGFPPNFVTGLQYSLTLDVAREVPLRLDDVVPTRAGVQKELRFIPHLGRTVDVSGAVDMGPDMTLASVRTELDRQWGEIACYARRHGARFADARPRDWRRYRFPDELRLRVADEESLTRLAKSWGWWYTNGHFGNPDPWNFPIRVRRVKLGLGMDFGYGLPEGRSFRVGASLFPPKGLDTKRWVATKGRRLCWAAFGSDVPGVVGASLILDLRRGVPIGSLRRRTEAFASHVAALARTLHARVD